VATGLKRCGVDLRIMPVKGHRNVKSLEIYIFKLLYGPFSDNLSEKIISSVRFK